MRSGCAWSSRGGGHPSGQTHRLTLTHGLTHAAKGRCRKELMSFRESVSQNPGPMRVGEEVVMYTMCVHVLRVYAHAHAPARMRKGAETDSRDSQTHGRLPFRQSVASSVCESPSHQLVQRPPGDSRFRQAPAQFRVIIFGRVMERRVASTQSPRRRRDFSWTTNRCGTIRATQGHLGAVTRRGEHTGDDIAAWPPRAAARE
jgi:hypothetical protein